LARKSVLAKTGRGGDGGLVKKAGPTRPGATACVTTQSGRDAAERRHEVMPGASDRADTARL
jgi:hypothetical protein